MKPALPVVLTEMRLVWCKEGAFNSRGSEADAQTDASISTFTSKLGSAVAGCSNLRLPFAFRFCALCKRLQNVQDFEGDRYGNCGPLQWRRRLLSACRTLRC